jgi:wyosine [tRNA(Phe)-imidazoG37] synthetase (radical SAM superfamily)
MLPSREKVKNELEIRLRKMSEEGQLPNVITFAGNGEPTLHPDFGGIIDDAIALRDQFAPNAKVAVLSNATMTYKEEVVIALKKVESNILKLDSGLESTIRIMNGPVADFSLDKLIDNLQQFDGKLFIQTMFLRGEFNGTPIDNTTDEEVDAWILAIQKIKPAMVMLYSLDRDTPAKNLIKVDAKTLRQIAAKVKALHIRVQVAV